MITWKELRQYRSGTRVIIRIHDPDQQKMEREERTEVSWRGRYAGRKRVRIGGKKVGCLLLATGTNGTSAQSVITIPISMIGWITVGAAEVRDDPYPRRPRMIEKLSPRVGGKKEIVPYRDAP